MTSTRTTCARCGRPVEPGEHLCAQCREEVGPAAAALPPESDLDQRSRRWPSTMVKPSPVQYHATIMVTIFLVLAGLAVWAFLGHRGVGPFDAKVVRQSSSAGGTETIVVEVTNQGSRSSRATCTFRALDVTDTELAKATELTAPIPGHETIDVTYVFRGLREAPAGFDTICT